MAISEAERLPGQSYARASFGDGYRFKEPVGLGLLPNHPLLEELCLLKGQRAFTNLDQQLQEPLPYTKRSVLISHLLHADPDFGGWLSGMAQKLLSGDPRPSGSRSPIQNRIRTSI